MTSLFTKLVYTRCIIYFSNVWNMRCLIANFQGVNEGVIKHSTIFWAMKMTSLKRQKTQLGQRLDFHRMTRKVMQHYGDFARIIIVWGTNNKIHWLTIRKNWTSWNDREVNIFSRSSSINSIFTDITADCSRHLSTYRLIKRTVFELNYWLRHMRNTIHTF